MAEENFTNKSLIDCFKTISRPIHGKATSMIYRGLLLLVVSVSLIFFLGCGKKIVRPDQKDAELHKKREDTRAEKEDNKKSYLDDYEVVDLNEKIRKKPGNAHDEQSQYGRDISDFNKDIELNPNIAENYNDRGNAFANKGRHDRAISDFNKAIDLKPDNAKAYFNRGNSYAAKGRHDKAISDYTKAIEINPDNADAFAKRGKAYSEKGKHDKAISDYERVVEITPDIAGTGADKPQKINSGFAVVYYNLGNDLAEKDQYDKAILAYDKALELDSGFAEAYNNRGTAYYSRSILDREISTSIKAIHMNISLPEGYKYTNEKVASDRAILDFTKAIDINPEYAEAYYNRGTAYSDQGLYDKAILDFTKAIEKNSEYAEAYYNRGNAYAEKGQYEQAITDYTGTIKITPGFAEAYYNRGNAFMLKSGDKVNACPDWKKACELGECEAFRLGKDEGYCE